jgi:hypothetical protein
MGDAHVFMLFVCGALTFLCVLGTHVNQIIITCSCCHLPTHDMT